MAGITNSGFEAKSFDQIKTELENAYRRVFGQDVNLSSTSIMGQMIGIFANDLSQVWELNDAGYDSRYIETARGKSLDNLVAQASLLRLSGVRTSGVAYLIGEPSVSVPIGTQFRSVTGVIYETLRDADLIEGVKPIIKITKRADESDSIVINPLNNLYGQFNVEGSLNFNYTGTLEAIKQAFETYLGVMEQVDSGKDVIESVVRNADNSLTITFNQNIFLAQLSSPEAMIEVLRAGLRDGVGVTISNIVEGPVITTAGQVNEILTPVDRLTGVINFEDFIAGRFAESDEDLRNRFRGRTRSAVTSTKDAIEREVLLLNGVSQAVCFLPSKDNSLNGGEIEVLVLGGVDDEIAQVIFNNNPSSKTIGSTVGIARDVNNNPFPVAISRPELLNFDIRVNISRNSNFPLEGVDEIIRLIGEFQNSVRFGNKLSPSPDLIYPLEQIQGLDFVEILISEAGANDFTNAVRNLEIKQIPNFVSIEVYENGVRL